MEAFRVLVELLKNHLWAGGGASVPFGSDEARALLVDIEYHASARLLCRKPFDQPLTSRDLQRAELFLTHLSESGKGKLDEKVNFYKELDPESLAVVAVLVNAGDTKRCRANTIEALCQGAKRIAKWSPWPHDPRLKKLVQEWAAASAAGAGTATSPAQPTPSPRDPPPQVEPLVLKCSSCDALLDFELTYKQATSGKPPSCISPPIG
jgi:hypothetical protein